jgi:hypothetical protein
MVSVMRASEERRDDGERNELGRLKPRGISPDDGG